MRTGPGDVTRGGLYGAAGPAGLGWATVGPADLDPDVRRLIAGIVRAVHDGDDPRIRNLLAELAVVADTDALLHLRRRLYDNVPAPGSDTDDTPASSDNRASLDKKGGAAGPAAPGTV
ncbi:hypothetical protein ACFWBC_38885 [Streptomyces sp. NPDC059985]|uniref:hypothetical protein n=1 Tax=Streptomyces sp. NPDC059985 TaxID=3347025 RepID=UPI0036C75F5B